MTQPTYPSPSQWEKTLELGKVEKEYGLPPGLLKAILTVESAGNPNAKSDKGAIGLFQIMPDTAAGLGVDPTKPAEAARGAAKYLADSYRQYGRWDRAVASYNCGSGNMNKLISGAVSTDYVNRDGKQPFSETVNYVNKVSKLCPSVAADAEDADTFGEGAGVAFMPFNVTAVATKSELESPIIFDGLETPGPLSGNPLVGNPHLRRLGFPAVFQVRLNENSSETLNAGKDSDKAISIPLNVSLRTINTRMSHIVGKKNTRTGFHISLWGRDIDTIGGSGSTGIFMNQLGLATLMSSNASIETLGLSYVAKFGGLMKEEQKKTGWYQGGLADAWNNLWTSKEEKAAAAADLKARKDANANLGNDTKALRVASQDAFHEILSLFKFNGIVRFRETPEKAEAQLNVATWGPQGISDAMANARRGDVMTRGYVVMKMKGRTYLGYFKSFTFTMDAEKPYTWDFEFSFKVLKSIRVAYVPNAGT